MRLNKINNYDKYFRTFFERVLEWNKVVGNDVNDKSLIPLYTNLLIEEAQEMEDATSAEDELDSLIDQLFVGGFLAELQGEALSVSPFDWGCYISCSEYLVRCATLEEGLETLEELMKIMTTLDINLHGALHHIVDSNFSKMEHNPLPSESDFEKYDKHCLAIMEQGRYTGVTWLKVGDYIVYRDDNGKLLKGMGYFEPSLSQFIN